MEISRVNSDYKYSRRPHLSQQAARRQSRRR
uniref:Uncharacterized protein n=1 Tax=Triticum urartu TaxID=4572 RepID=A0A8R7P2Q8_TRIUA